MADIANDAAKLGGAGVSTDMEERKMPREFSVLKKQSKPGSISTHNSRSHWVLSLCCFFIGLFSLCGSALSAQDGPRSGVVTLSIEPAATISPLIYGINYDWNKVSSRDFPAWNRALLNVAHYTLLHFPGGWNPEHYDWSRNEEPYWRNVNGNGFDPSANLPGIAPEALLSSVPSADFIVPSLQAIKEPERIPEVAALAADLVRKYGNRVKLWDIGNEWWLQRGAKKRPAIREENLRRYAALVAAVVPAMKAANPSSQVFAGGDWQDPGQFGALHDLVGSAVWSQLDGLSVHTYCNWVQPTCSSIPAAADAIRSITGKQKIFDSQWFVTRKLMTDNYGIKNANYLVMAIQYLALARMEAAIIWPVTDYIPELNFVSSDYKEPYAPGILFGWMSRYYRGEALRTTGTVPAVAAKSAQGVTIFVPALSSGPLRVQIPLSGTGLSRVVSAEVLYAANYEDPIEGRKAESASLPIALTHNSGGEASIDFTLNPGTPGRGEGWEIARVTVE